MFDSKNFKDQLFSTTPQNFETKALEVFNYQWAHNTVYRLYCDHLHIDPKKIDNVGKIPFLPIEFFKTHTIKTGKFESKKVFLSSGTTGQVRSKHHLRDIPFYHAVARRTFEERYGKLNDWEIFALLPSYLEQENSSLISMVDYFIASSQPTSRFVLNDFEIFEKSLCEKPLANRLIIGVSYALLDFGSQLKNTYPPALIMETGGMKGRRKEIVRSELHEKLKSYFAVDKIHSEYGMTELLSQAYGSKGRFTTPPWCRILIRDIHDPFSFLAPGKTGGINIIDLANVDSCAFIETKDLGIISENADFEILGRFDNTDLRGCNLLV